jgi:isoleucyl-tRNA synthetase
MAEENKNLKSEAALKEESVLEFWQKNQIFEKSLSKPSPKGEFVFYEGPPTANGRPGIHHILARAFKDIIPRYKTMQGFHVRRKAGWDTHGLPVELEVEKQLGLKSKKEIESYGIAEFNKKCRESVWKYLDEWQKFTTRIGYWVDQDNPYITYKKEYIESLWAVVKKVHEQNLLYKDYKVIPWCPRCGTALSSHELAQGYQDVKDLSLYVKFEVVGEPNTYVLAWTTTPWTLPGNVALAVGEKIAYVKVKLNNEFYIVAKDRLSILEGEYEIVGEFTGSDLVGKSYKPIYDFISKSLAGAEKGLPELRSEAGKLANAYKIYRAGFVTTEDGTGIVHTAVMYGQDDFELGTKVGLPKKHLVSESGEFLPEAGFLAGRFVKDLNTEIEILKDLASRNILYKKEKYEHSYPFCWRCKTPLIYYARDSWYIRMSSLREKLVAENENINWEPSHIKEGRFGEWLREIKDWAISRERYWGTPLPAWVCSDCGERKVVGSIEELKEAFEKPKNKYFVMRHGEADSNVLQIVCSNPADRHKLTPLGERQASDAAIALKDKKIDIIFHSPFQRAEKTAQIVAEKLGISKENLRSDERIREIKAGELDGCRVDEYHAFFKDLEERFTKAPVGGENYLEIKKRMGDFLYDVEKGNSGKNILIVTHDAPAWMLFAAASGLSEKESVKIKGEGTYFIKNAEIKELPFDVLPHDEYYTLDLHRPYIDDLAFKCKCGGGMKRIREVMDVWFDSGAMPFAQDHYPFENKDWIEKKGYPADYISEAIDQTRGWFYTLHAVGVLMERGKAYKNVICLGHILDAQGKKMSKSLGNVVNPWEMMDKYGVDTLRYFMYSVNQPGESKNFDERTVVEVQRKIFNLLENVHKFYELYENKQLTTDNSQPESKNILDQWILSRLNELIDSVTKNLDGFKITESTRAIRDFIDDLSTWYLRRSRDRFKGEAETDKKSALLTTHHVLMTLARILAPFSPFYAENLFQKLKSSADPESVHLDSWPDKGEIHSHILENMRIVREVVTAGLEARQGAGIKVRQPLNQLTIKNYELKEKQEYIELIKDELNVKNVVFDEKISDPVGLDTQVTPELKDEGNFRELLRAIQDLRKKQGLTPSDSISLRVEADEVGSNLIGKFESDLKKSALIKELKFAAVPEGHEIKVENSVFKVVLER